jgi:hypothetical protein
VAAGGAYTITTTALADGTHSITARATDTAGNTSLVSPALAVTIDTLAPAIAIATIAGDDTVNAGEVAAGFAISGTSSGLEDGQVASVSIVDGANAVVDSCTATVTNNAWSVNVTANVADRAGNPASTAARALTVDASAPSLLASISDRELNAGETATVGFAFSDAPLGFTLSDATATGGALSNLVQLDTTHFTATFTPAIAINPIATVNAGEAAAEFAISGTTTDAEDGQPVNVTIRDAANATIDSFTTTVAAGIWSVSVAPAQAIALGRH